MTDTLADLMQAADLLLLGGDTAEALDYLDRAVALAPDDPEPHYRRAELLMTVGEPDSLRAALDSLNRAISLGMDTADTRFKQMRTRAELGQISAARDAYRAAVTLAPDDGRLREWGVRLALLDGQPDEALALARQELAAAPDNFYWGRWVAELLLTMGDAPAAQDAFTALLDAHLPPNLAPGDWTAPQWGDILLKRAEACRRAGDLTGASADLDRAVPLLPGDPGVPFLRGMVAWAAGNPDGALPLFRTALNAAPTDMRARFMADLADYPRRADLLSDINLAENHAGDTND